MLDETAVLGKQLVAGMKEFADGAVYNMKRGIDGDKGWHAEQDDESVFVVLELGLPKIADFPMLVEIEGETYGVMTGIRIPVGTIQDYPVLYN